MSNASTDMFAGKAWLWTGYVMSGLVIAFMTMDFTIKFLDLPIVDQTHIQLGWQPGWGRYLGSLLFACTVLYAWPRTAVLGAVLLTAYLGGAVATHLRVGSPLFTHVLFGVYLGLFVWGGLWLREPRLRALLPIR